MQLGNGLLALDLGFMDLGQGLAVGPLPQLGGEGAQSHIVAGLGDHLKPLHSFGLLL